MAIKKTDLRPTIVSSSITSNENIEEKFQNESLRPIIKLQHDLIIACFENFLSIHKIKIEEMTLEQQDNFFSSTFKNNTQLKVNLRSLIIGLFTFNEYNYYLQHSTKVNKRINDIIQKRIRSIYNPSQAKG